MHETWWVYCILCKGGGLYVGIARDVAARYKKHCDGQGAFYTKLNPPERLLGCYSFSSRTEAMREEKRVKKLDPLKKLLYVRALAPPPPDLVLNQH
jgi:putative endonuclease